MILKLFILFRDKALSYKAMRLGQMGPRLENYQ